MSTLNIETVVAAWRDQDFFEGLESSMQDLIPASPAGKVKMPVIRNPDGLGECITLLNDNCNLTMVGPDGCLA
jgi:mersacidin/lichenicidin family type 2 lantibiotic